MYRLLANIAYVRNNCIASKMRWKKIGKLYYSKESHSAKIFLGAMHYGMCIAKPTLDDTPPFLQGEIIVTINNEYDTQEDMFIGFISTCNTSDTSPAYTIMFESLPFSNGPTWLDIRLEDKDGFISHEDKEGQSQQQNLEEKSGQEVGGSGT